MESEKVGPSVSLNPALGNGMLISQAAFLACLTVLCCWTADGSKCSAIYHIRIPLTDSVAQEFQLTQQASLRLCFVIPEARD